MAADLVELRHAIADRRPDRLSQDANAAGKPAATAFADVVKTVALEAFFDLILQIVQLVLRLTFLFLSLTLLLADLVVRELALLLFQLPFNAVAVHDSPFLVW
jgi:hypothetical protein